MDHTTEVVETKQVADSMIAVKIRCCGDASTDSWHSLETSSQQTDEERQAWLDERLLQVQATHENCQVARNFFTKLAKPDGQ